MGLAAHIWSRVRAFLNDDSGAAGIEFLCTCPLMFGVLVFTAEYGEALRVRTTLDAATADAVRLLSRAPAAMVEQDGVPLPDFYPEFEEQARQIIETRTGLRLLDYSERAPAFEIGTTAVDLANYRTPYVVVDLTATVVVQMPLLSLFGLYKPDQFDGVPTESGDTLRYAIAMTSAARGRYTGATPPGVSACPQVDRMNNTCPGS